MDFIEDIEPSPPCFIVPDSQKEDSVFTRSNSEILKQLAISARTEFDSVRGKSDTDRNTAVNSYNRNEADLYSRKVMTGSVEGGKAAGDPPGPPGGGSDQGSSAGGNGSRGGGGADDGGDDHGGDGGGGDDGGGGSGGNGSGGDDGDGNGNGSHENQETSTEQEEADVSESTPSESDNSMPQLVRPVDGTTNPSVTQRRYSASDIHIARDLPERSESSDLSQSASNRSAGMPADPGPGHHGHHVGPTYSEASTAVVGEAAAVDVGNLSDVQSVRSSRSDASTAVIGGASHSSEKLSPSTLSSGSSCYPADTSGSSVSSLSSSTSTLPIPPEKHAKVHYPVGVANRTQLTSDTSTSSTSSKEEVGHAHKKWSGFHVVKTVKEKQQKSSNDDEEDGCASSQDDLFAPPGEIEQAPELTRIASQEETRIQGPKDHSTPKETEETPPQVHPPQPTRTLFRSVLTKQITSTPIDGTERTSLSTPSDQGTPIDTFNCLQFSGTVKESESSSDVISPSLNSMPSIIPSSPTEINDGGPSAQIRPQEWSVIKEQSFTIVKEREQPSEVMDVATSLIQSPDPEEQPAKFQQQRQPSGSEEDEDEIIVLPKWNQELLKRERAKYVEMKTLSTKSTMSDESSSGDSRSDKSDGKYSLYHQWQSQGLIESGNLEPGSDQGEEKIDKPVSLSLHLSDDSENQDVTSGFREPITSRQVEPSLSPSSVVLQPIESHPYSDRAFGPTQPQMSHDIFQPPTVHVSQPDTAPRRQQPESAQVTVIMEDKPGQQIIDEGKVGDDEIAMEVEPSQGSVSSFDLHLTQSETESESQEIIEPTRHFTHGHHVKAINGSSTVTSKAVTEGEMPCEPLHFGGHADIQVESQKDSEQEMVIQENICEPEKDHEQDVEVLEVKKLSSVQHRKEKEYTDAAKSKQELPVPGDSNAKAKKPCKDLRPAEKILVPDESSHPEVIVISPLSSVPSVPSQSILAPLAAAAAVLDQREKQPATAPRTGASRQPEEVTSPAEIERQVAQETHATETEEQAQIADTHPHAATGDTHPHTETTDTHPHVATGDTQLLSRAGVSKALASMFSAETPSESSTCEQFHFSLPKGKEPLKPVTCTTPPPLRVARPLSPESQERHPRLRHENAEGSVVCETPGMSTQVLSSVTSALPRPQVTPSLMLSMPRYESQGSESDSPEPVFHLEKPAMPASSVPASTCRKTPRSLFKENIDAGRQRERASDSEDPFQFTAQDATPEPPRKRAKRGKEQEKDLEAIGEKRAGKAKETSSSERSSSPRRKRGLGEGIVERTVKSPSKKVRTKEREDKDTEKDLEVISEKGAGKAKEKSSSAGNSSPGQGKRKRGSQVEGFPELQTQRFRRITHRRTIKKVTVKVKRVVTIEMINDSSGDLVESLTYEEDEEPEVKLEEKESTDEEEEIVTTFNQQASLRAQVFKPPEPGVSSKKSRKSPRTRSSGSSSHSDDSPRPTRASTRKSRTSSQSSSSASVDDSAFSPLQTRASTELPQESPQSSSSDGSGKEPLQTRAFTRISLKSPHTKNINTSGSSDETGHSLRPVRTLSSRSLTSRAKESRNLPDKSSDGEKGASKEQSGEKPTNVTTEQTLPLADVESRETGSPPLCSNTRVLAKWLDAHYYPGKVLSGPTKSGFYCVMFDDGDKRRIRRENLLVKDKLPVGQHVLVQGEDDCYSPGRIVGHYREMNNSGYTVEGDDHVIKRYPQSKVILTADQATMANLSQKSSSSSAKGSPLDTSADTSSKDTSRSSAGTSPRPRKVPRGSPDVDKGEEKTNEDETPKSTRKSSSRHVTGRGRRDLRRVTAESSSDSLDEKEKEVKTGKRHARRGLGKAFSERSPGKRPKYPPVHHVSPARRSPRRKTSTSVEEHTTGSQTTGSQEHSELGPLPKDQNLFAGFAFILTGVAGARDAPDETDSESEMIEYDRDHLTQQIEAGGGVILSSFDQSQVSAAESCFLISNTHRRTQKYFQSLAHGIPCVSHAWINDCSTQNVLLDHRRYVLPSGENIETGELVEARNRPNILGGMTVHLHGSEGFKTMWSCVALAAGCSVVTKLPTRPLRLLAAENIDYGCDVIICQDRHIPAGTLHKAQVLGIPVVALEWLLQCLINGRRVAFDGHPKYHYENA